MRIAVAGGTGLVGRHLVAALTAAGHEPVVLSRSRGVDLARGTGLVAALDGADAVVDVTNVETLSRRVSVGFFAAVTQNLLAAGKLTGVGHHVALSIIGTDRVETGYHAGKLRQEQLVLGSSSVPGSVLRAAQFHEFADQVLARSRGPVAVVPRMRAQPVAVREVADALVGLVTNGPVGRAPDLAGPEVREVVDMARTVLRARGLPRPVLGVRVPGSAGRAMAEGALLPDGPGPRGVETFDEWLFREVVAPPREGQGRR